MEMEEASIGELKDVGKKGGSREGFRTLAQVVGLEA